MPAVRPKKHFGQHFLKDAETAARIAGALQPGGRYRAVLEIGPGTGVLTQHLFRRDDLDVTCIDIDTESVEYLKKHFAGRQDRIREGDVLTADLSALFPGAFGVIGNFPYNISSQILFRVLDFRDRIPEVVGMFQKEVAVRIASGPGNRDYGILSVLLQAYYDVTLLMTLDEDAFVPPPAVKSAVIRLVRRDSDVLSCAHADFVVVVKTAFGQRRKTLRNALKSLANGRNLPYLDQRAEQLHWKQFEELTRLLFPA
jgi:16S rRNA (adenine1518-N6/adenine1519-N6)-dimethyltransferase